MRYFIGVLVSLWLSLTIAWVSRGADLTSREFWAGGWFYGLPLLVLSPLYLSLFRRVPQRVWVRAATGVALTPLPLITLLVITAGLGAPINRDSGLPLAWGPLITLYAFWYAMFGAFLGAWTMLLGKRPSDHDGS